MPMVQNWPDSPYYVLVCRKEEAPVCKVWPAYFQKPLPELSIPLATPDPDVPLALQPLIGEIYARSRYHLLIDYRQPLRPRLSPAEATWVKQRLRKHRARK